MSQSERRGNSQRKKVSHWELVWTRALIIRLYKVFETTARLNEHRKQTFRFICAITFTGPSGAKMLWAVDGVTERDRAAEKVVSHHPNMLRPINLDLSWWAEDGCVFILTKAVNVNLKFINGKLLWNGSTFFLSRNLHQLGRKHQPMQNPCHRVFESVISGPKYSPMKK